MRFLEEQVINILLESDIQDYDTQCKNQEVLQEVLQSYFMRSLSEFQALNLEIILI